MVSVRGTLAEMATDGLGRTLGSSGVIFSLMRAGKH